MQAVRIRENIYWVGGIDWDLRNFHGYVTQRGSSYNAYLIIDEKITLIDTVKHYLTDEMISRIRSVIDPSQIDYIVSNHVEMDHSGGLPAIIDITPNAEIITSPQGLKGLKKHYSDNYPYRAIANGEEIETGNNTLKFILTPMVHWPDNMVTYLKEEKILFSNDAFGQHIASSQRYAGDLGISLVMEEARKYYANIVLPYSSQVQKALEALSDVELELIAPSHGVMWKKQIPAILKNYRHWSGNHTEKEAVIVYDSMWGSTRQMAYAVLDAFAQSGYNAQMMDLKYNHISDIMTHMMTAEYLCVGSPTLNNNMLPTVSAFLTYLKGLAPKNRKAIVFGSYGWGGQATKIVEEMLQSADFDVKHTEKYQYVPTEEYLQQLMQTVKGVLNDGKKTD